MRDGGHRRSNEAESRCLYNEEEEEEVGKKMRKEGERVREKRVSERESAGCVRVFCRRGN